MERFLTHARRTLTRSMVVCGLAVVFAMGGAGQFAAQGAGAATVSQFDQTTACGEMQSDYITEFELSEQAVRDGNEINWKISYTTAHFIVTAARAVGCDWAH